MNQVCRPALRPATGVRFGVLAWLCGLATLSYVHRGCVAVPADLIQQDLGLTRDEMGQVMFAFFLGYSAFQIPSGWLGDRWGTRRVLTVLIVVWTLATGWMAFAGGLLGLWLARFVNGVAQAGIFPCSVNSVARWFPESGKAFPSGMLGSFMSVGAVIGSALTGLLLGYLDWRTVFVVLALPGLLAAAAFWWWFRDRPEDMPAVSVSELAWIRQGRDGEAAARARPAPLPVMTMLTSARLWLVCGQQFCRAAGYIFYLTWFPTFLQQTRDVSVSGSGYLTSLPLLGVVIGSAAGGRLMDAIYRLTGSRYWSRKQVAVSCLLAASVLVCLAYPVADPLWASLLLSLSSLCAGACGAAAYTVTMDLGGRHVGTVFSTMNMVGNIGAALLPLVVVRLVDATGWNDVLWLLASLYFAAAACWVLLNVEGGIFPPVEPTATSGG